MTEELVIIIIHAGLVFFGIPYAVFVMWDEDLKYL